MRSTKGIGYIEKRQKYYNEVIRLHIEEGYGGSRIARIIPVSRTTALRWIANFASENGKVTPQTNMPRKENQPKDELEALKAEIAALEEQLRMEKMRTRFNEKMIEIAEAKFNIPIRKKAGAKQ